MLIPWAIFSWTTTKAPARITTAGRTQMSDNRPHRERAGTALGRSSKSGFEGSVMPRRIPQKPLIECARREQGEDYDRPEGPGSPADDDRGEGLHLHQCGKQGYGVNVEHRPPSDELHHPIQLAALQPAARGAAPGGIKQNPQSEYFQQRHDDAGNEYQQGDGPGPGLQQHQYTAHDGVAFVVEEGPRVHHRQKVRRDVEHGGADEQYRGDGKAVRLALV